MSVQTVTTRTCDYCGIEIRTGTTFVAAGVYGSDFHKYCFERKMDALALAKLAGLDEIEYAKANEGEDLPDIIGRAWRVKQEPDLNDYEQNCLKSGELS